MRLNQINLQQHFGGGEVFTAFLCRALDRIGIATNLVHHREADFWHTLNLPTSVTLHPVASPNEIVPDLPLDRGWVLSHGPLPERIAAGLAEKHLLTGIAHMPPQGRPRDCYRHYDLVFGVSAYVVEGLRAVGVPVWDDPLYGVADLARGAGNTTLWQTSRYDWDKRKGRDRLMGWIEPLIKPLRSRPLFEKLPGITLGIVSRLTPIKQFPQLFELISPLLADHPAFNLEIFGSGGYASVRDLKRALRPLGNRARFWGHQHNIAAIYSQLDYLITGLPEKEALGLNVIEAQACGIPVLAVYAPPFTETVIDGRSGFLYRDPREDRGADFSKLLAHIDAARPKIDPRLDQAHLARFSFDAFVDRLKPVAAWASTQLAG